MYQYSLAWFMGLFRLGIQNATASEVLAERLKNIIDYFTFSIYQNVCRSLFEKHKLLFSFLLCVRIMQGDDKIDSEEFKFLLSGPPSTKTDGDNPAPEWMTINSWTEFSNMHFELPHFEGVTDIVREHKDTSSCHTLRASPTLCESTKTASSRCSTRQYPRSLSFLSPLKSVCPSFNACSFCVPCAWTRSLKASRSTRPRCSHQQLCSSPSASSR